MTWVESQLGGFRARHNEDDARDARRVLQSLSLTELRMAELFPRPVGELTVVLHSGVVSLTLAHPVLPLVWLTTAPAARRYVAGWAGRDELHVLSPKVLRGRASNVTGSREMLALSAAALYARRIVIENNRELAHVFAPRAGAPGAAMGVADRGRGALVLRPDRPRPAGDRPPAARGRTSPISPRLSRLGVARWDRVRPARGRARASGPRRSWHLILSRAGPRAALTAAFGGRAIEHTEGAWRAHLARLAGAS